MVFHRPVTEAVIPPELNDVITGVCFVEPPEFYTTG
jgi:hypothetical protein